MTVSHYFLTLIHWTIKSLLTLFPNESMVSLLDKWISAEVSTVARRWKHNNKIENTSKFSKTRLFTKHKNKREKTLPKPRQNRRQNISQKTMKKTEDTTTFHNPCVFSFAFVFWEMLLRFVKCYCVFYLWATISSHFFYYWCLMFVI